MSMPMRVLSLFAVVCLAGVAQPAAAPFTFEHGDRVAIIGNALPDRMQHDGWLEAYLQLANPGKDLVIRNMGFSGDQVAHRPREESFPSADWYLTHVRASVIFAFFGYNESFGRAPERFKKQLADFIDETRAKRYDGEHPPRIVLLSPIAFEDLQSPNFPDGNEHNLWLSIHTDAMARVARDKQVAFVDLFAPTLARYAESEAPLTINGAHLNEAGNRFVAETILRALGQPLVEENLDSVRGAVLRKNWCWFNRYRATDGNDVWGNRSTLKFVDDQTNAEVLQHELVMLDIMTGNRDNVVWAAARGESIDPDDSNVPNPVPVKTNFRSHPKKGSLKYIPAEEGVNTLTLAPGLQANLFASEAMFPELVNPVQLDVDPRGRLWAAAWQTYPKWQPDREMLDRLLILPDDDGDGVADRAITFACVHNPTAFTFWNGGVVVCSAPNIWFFKDTTGDDRADHVELLFTGLDSADTHHSANGFDYGPDGYIYYQRGVFNVSNVETPWQAGQLSGISGMYRFNPRTHRFSFHAENSPNPHGGDFDYWGYHYATDATSGRAFQVRMAGGGRFAMHEMFEKTVRPVPSSGILSSTHFPDEYNGSFIILNAIGFLGIKQYRLHNNDGVVTGTEIEDLLVSSDPNFRPSDFKVGVDGALYVADWANAIIGHMQHNIRDPSRDNQHGRIYRVTAPGRPLESPPAIAGQPIEALLDVLKHPTDGVRLRARIELSARDTGEVVAAAAKWIAQFDPSAPEHAHHLLEALWLHQQHNVVNEGLLTVLLHSDEPHARRAAERVKYIWEIEGRLGDVVQFQHAAHGHGGPDGMELVHDYLKQDPTPDPEMVGDTMVVHIQTLKEQMKYDRSAFAVAPGMKVRLVFSNPDAMDHNLLIVRPGAAAQVAMAAMMLGEEGIAKQWIPENDNVLVASRMLAIGQSETLEFTAPDAPGEYDYLCTYPGHWTLMRGVMHVVEDVEQWMADNPDTTETKARAFVREWKVSDLAADLGRLAQGRSLERGAAVFREASCVACHQPASEGAGLIGPDLAGLAERFDPQALLTELLAPSAVINEQYQSWKVEVETEDVFEADTLYGLVVDDDADHIRVVENPLQDPAGIRIARDRVKEMTAAPLSAMPEGLLNSFSSDEILDLMAYLLAMEPVDEKPAPRRHGRH